jgi:hypothetical protein
MATARRRPNDEIFVIRVWSEDEASARGAWRASVTHAVTRERRFFTNYGELCEFLDRWRVRLGM